MKKVLFLFNTVRTGRPEISRNHYYGMYEMRKYGIDTDFLEIEQVWPKWLCSILRKKILTMHYAHIPLFLKFFKYDTVFTSTAYGSLLIKSIFNIKKFKWVALDFNFLGTIGDAKTTRQKVFKWMISKVDGIVTISQAEKDGLEKMFPHLKDKIKFIHEATDLKTFLPQDTNRNIKPYILTVGKYGRDFDTIVEALKDAPYQVKIATKPSLIQHLSPLPANITANLYSHAEMVHLYKNAAVVIVAVNPRYSTDSVGTLTVGEAMAMKKAVIATDTLSMRSYIKSGTNGILVPQSDSGAMKTAAIELMEHKEKAESLAENGHEFAKKYLALDYFALKVSDFIKNINEEENNE